MATFYGPNGSYRVVGLHGRYVIETLIHDKDLPNGRHLTWEQATTETFNRSTDAEATAHTWAYGFAGPYAR